MKSHLKKNLGVLAAIAALVILSVGVLAGGTSVIQAPRAALRSGELVHAGAWTPYGLEEAHRIALLACFEAENASNAGDDPLGGDMVALLRAISAAHNGDPLGETASRQLDSLEAYYYRGHPTDGPASRQAPLAVRLSSSSSSSEAI